MQWLMVNVGSSTIKLSVVDKSCLTNRQPLWHAKLCWSAQQSTLKFQQPDGAITEEQGEFRDANSAGKYAARWLYERQHLLTRIAGVGHRIVHGGTYEEPILIDSDNIQSLMALTPYASLHQTQSLAVVDAMRAVFPALDQYGCFDTMLYQDLPEKVRRYPIRESWADQFHLQRVGFHGLSHRDAFSQSANLLKSDRCGRVLTCHLGSGCSITAFADGKPVDTTMGVTPLSGLMMGTRCGTIAPEILLLLIRQHNLTADELEFELSSRSGLLGVSDLSPDYREIEQAASDGHAKSRLAIDMFVRSIAQHIAALAVSLGGIDAIVFTGGIGENSTGLRASVVEQIQFLDVEIDATANENNADTISSSASKIACLRVNSREDLAMLQSLSTVTR